MALSSSSSREREFAPEPAPGGRDRRVGLTPVSLFLVLLLAWVLIRIELVLILALLAIVFGTIIERPVQRLEQQRIPRPAGILLIYVIIIGTLVLLSWAIAPGIADQVATFNEQVPDQLRELERDWRTSGNPILSGPGGQLLRQLIERLDQPATVTPDTAQAVIPVITNVTAFVVSALTLLVITFYYVMEKALLRRLVLDQLSAESRTRVSRVWDDVEAKVGGWMRGQLLLCLIIGTIATISYGIIDLRFWPLLGLWAGLTEIIPIVGPWIGGVPAVIVALTMSWEKAIVVTAVILGMQTLENWVLVPRVMRGAVGLTPLTVFVAILAGTQLMGVIGAVLAIPIAATVQVIVTDYLDMRRGRRTAADAMAGWRWMLTRSGRAQATRELGTDGQRGDLERGEGPERARTMPASGLNRTEPETAGETVPTATITAEQDVQRRNGAARAGKPGRQARQGRPVPDPERASEPRRGPATRSSAPTSRRETAAGWSRSTLDRFAGPRTKRTEDPPPIAGENDEPSR